MIFNKMIKVSKRIKSVLFICIVVCIVVNFTVKSPVIKFHNRWKDDHSAWETTKHGDLACFSMFVKENLFKGDLAEYELVVMTPQKYDKSQFFGKFWKSIPSIYLFPMKIIISNNYQESLTKEKYQDLRQLPWAIEQYRSGFLHQKRDFYIGTDIAYNDFKQLGLYVFTDKESVEHIFILPLKYDLLNE